MKYSEMPRILATGVVVFLLGAVPAVCCSCFPTTLAERVEVADAVFVGKVIKLEIIETRAHADTARATVQTLEVVKGAVPEEVEFVVSNGCCYCDWWFDLAVNYLIFARGDGAELSTGVCEGTGTVRERREDLEVLGLAHLLPDPSDPKA